MKTRTNTPPEPRMQPTASRGSFGPRIARWLGLVAVSLALAGCDLARTVQPIGSLPADLGALKLDGTWRDAEGRVYFLRTTEPATGQLEMATIQTNASGFELNRIQVFLRDQGDVLLGSFRGVAPDPEPNFAFGRLAVTEDTLVLHLAPVTPIRGLIVDGALGGILTTNSNGGDGAKGSVTVTNGFARLAAALAAPDGSRLLDLQHPFVLFRQKAGFD